MKIMYFDERTRVVADLAQINYSSLWLITRINVPAPYRGKKLGSKILKEIVKDADDEGVTLTLIPYSSGPLSNADLIAWYKRYGFTQSTSGYMTREPQP